jgi:hypothetical protein
MTRGKAPKDIQERREEKKPEVLPKWSLGNLVRHAVPTWIGRTILWVSAVLGIASGYVALIPHVSVSQSQPLNISDPFSTPFIVTNEGPLGIRDVHFECYPFSIKTKNANEITGIGFVPLDLHPERMNPGERATVPCYFPITMDPLQSADVALIVTFKVAFVPLLNFENDYRFQALRAGDKNLYWFPQPLTSPIPPQHSRMSGPSAIQGVNTSQ